VHHTAGREQHQPQVGGRHGDGQRSPSASQVTGLITSDPVPIPPSSTTWATRAQLLPWRSCAARYTAPVKTNSRTATPTVTWAAEPTSPLVASTHDQGGLEQARGDRGQPQQNRGSELLGDARPADPA